MRKLDKWGRECGRDALFSHRRFPAEAAQSSTSDMREGVLSGKVLVVPA